MSDNLETFCEHGKWMRSWCEQDPGPEAMSITFDGVMLQVTAAKAVLATPAGVAEIDLDQGCYVDPERWSEAAPSSSKQHWNDVRDA